MSTVLETTRTPTGIECRTATGELVARIVYHAHDMWEIWAEKKFRREGFPFLWTGISAAEYAVLALACDGEADPMAEVKPDTIAGDLLTTAKAVEVILAPFIDAGISAPHMIEAVTNLRAVIKRAEG